MFKANLQNRLMGAFLLIGIIVLVVGIIGWSSSSKLSEYLNATINIHLKTTASLGEINRNITQIRFVTSLRLDPEISPGDLQKVSEQIQGSLKKLEQEMSTLEVLLVDNQDKTLYQQFKQTFNSWKETHNFLENLENQYTEIGLRNPWKKEVELLINNQEKSPEMQRVKAAIKLRETIAETIVKRRRPLSLKLTEIADEMLRLNDVDIASIEKAANADMSHSKIWVLVGMIIGPITALVLGIYFSIKIAKPLETQVQHSGISITSSATQIAAAGKELEAVIKEQVASTSEVVSTAREISATSEELVHTMEEVVSRLQVTAQAAGNGQQDLTQMESTMRQLANATLSISSKLGVISEKANNINSVVTTITKVADQTNLLSLNAAIEAEKAEEYGRGFAVVAREIRRLADQTAVATLDIEQIVKDMQSAVATGVMEMDKFTKEVSQGVHDIRRISGQIIQVIEAVQNFTPQFESISHGMEEQSFSAQQISEAMVQLNEISRQTADTLSGINEAIGQLNEVALGLQQKILALK